MRLNKDDLVTIEQPRTDNEGVVHYRQFNLLIRAIHDDWAFVTDTRSGKRFEIARDLLDKQCVLHVKAI